MSELRVEAIGKRFGDGSGKGSDAGGGGKTVLDDVTFTAPKGEIVALLGPSGSGKTTLLRIVAGFETADRGTIRWGEQRIDTLPPEKRDFGMVFQHYALFPHMTVGENVAFGLEARKAPKREIPERVAAALARVDLAGFERRRVGEISGGQQQRVALARALAPEPRALLLDEPLSNLDPALRERTRRELAQTLRRIGITTLLVTHEQEEAFDLGDRVALLHAGKLDQIGTARELYRAPATRFAAAFMGRASFLPVEVLEADAAKTVVGGSSFAPGRTLAVARDGSGSWKTGEAAELWLRPEMLELRAPTSGGTGNEAIFAGMLAAERFGGATSFASVRLADGSELEVTVSDDAPAAGESVEVALRRGARPKLFAKERPA